MIRLLILSLQLIESIKSSPRPATYSTETNPIQEVRREERSGKIVESKGKGFTVTE